MEKGEGIRAPHESQIQEAQLPGFAAIMELLLSIFSVQSPMHNMEENRKTQPTPCHIGWNRRDEMVTMES